MEPEFELEFELEPYHERIISNRTPADAPDIDRTSFHEVGNYLQPLILQAPEFGAEIKQEFYRFKQSTRDQDESKIEEIKQKISDLGEEYGVKNDSEDGERFRMVEAGLESTEDYYRMLQGKETGPVELEKILSSFNNCENIEVNYKNIEPEEEISAGMEYWVALNTLWKNTKDHHDRDGEVEINVRKDQNIAVIEYSDCGPGIPEPEREDMFELGAEETGLKTLSEIVSYNNGWVKYEDLEDDWQIKMYIPTSN